MTRRLSILACIAALASARVPDALAQAPARPGKLIVTVQDSTGGVLPAAEVIVTGAEAATRAAVVAPIKATDQGVATFENLVVGRYTIEATFSGFEKGTLRDVRVRAGDNRQTITLELSRMQDSVRVGPDREEGAADRGSTFGNALTREQIDALSDNRDELQRQLQDLAGPDAVIAVDSFEGRDLPPKSQIKSIRISRDQFAAEMHSAGGTRIEIVTQPGIGPLRGSFSTNYYTSALDGVNPIVGRTPPGLDRGVNASLSGTLMKNRMSFSIYGYGDDGYSTSVLNAGSASGAIDTRVLNSRDSSRYAYVSTQLDYALTKDQTLRMSLYRNINSSNGGTGGYNLPERAVKSDNNSTQFYLQEIGPLGRRFVTNTRVSLYVQDRTDHSAVEAPTIVVLDEFTSGGAQRKGSIHNVNGSIASDLDYIRGAHSGRAGVDLGIASYHDGQTSNYLGTYTFTDLDSYNAGLPRSYTRRVGDPTIDYGNLTAALYLQDDIKLRKNLTITPGLRYEAQMHVKDRLNFGPRFG
ncbi:MAG TPA: carboxypeptidase regulatory-like domain-containing protein, partial [Vicinamibacterales bacterium]|nr:carboxypeptidase regulatory-like domain-containing protein [Vicinamibacterales bacterium]